MRCHFVAGIFSFSIIFGTSLSANAQTTTCPSPAGYVQIRKATDLDKIRTNLNGKYFFCNDISLTTPFQPINGVFQGTLNGNGKAIQNLRITQPSRLAPTGFFQEIGTRGVVKALSFSNAKIEGNVSVGAFSGINRGLIQTSALRGVSTTATKSTVSGKKNVGGFSGETIFGSIEGSIATYIDVSSREVNDASYVGGFTGRCTGCAIRNSSISSGTVTSRFAVGGFVGNGDSAFIERGTVSGITVRATGEPDMFEPLALAGGLIGIGVGSKVIDTRVSASVLGSISAPSLFLGGLIGVEGAQLSSPVIVPTEGGVIIRSSFSGTIRGGQIIGGLVGRLGTSNYTTNGGLILDSYATGTITGNPSTQVGGLVGAAYSTTIATSYSTIALPAGCYSRTPSISSCGGVIGESFLAPVRSEVHDTFYSLAANPGLPYNGYGQPKTDVQLKQKVTYRNWDISSTTVSTLTTWKIAPGAYPYLRR